MHSKCSVVFYLIAIATCLHLSTAHANADIRLAKLKEFENQSIKHTTTLLVYSQKYQSGLIQKLPKEVVSANLQGVNAIFTQNFGSLTSRLQKFPMTKKQLGRLGSATYQDFYNSVFDYISQSIDRESNLIKRQTKIISLLAGSGYAQMNSKKPNPIDMVKFFELVISLEHINGISQKIAYSSIPKNLSRDFGTGYPGIFSLVNLFSMDIFRHDIGFEDAVWETKTKADLIYRFFIRDFKGIDRILLESRDIRRFVSYTFYLLTLKSKILKVQGYDNPLLLCGDLIRQYNPNNFKMIMPKDGKILPSDTFNHAFEYEKGIVKITCNRK